MTNADTRQPVLLETHALSRHVAGQVLVDAITMCIAAGEIVALVGPSGAGKTSLLRLLTRLDEPTSGTVWLDGQDYRTIAPRVLRRQIGLVMQQPVLFPGTVADNIRFGPLQDGRVLTDAEVTHLLAQVGLSGYAARDTARLSGGEAQRVALLRAVANRPRVLLLDEPTSALDAASAQAVEELVQQWVTHQQGASILVSHQAAQIDRLAQRRLQLSAGRLVTIPVFPEGRDAAPAHP